MTINNHQRWTIAKQRESERLLQLQLDGFVGRDAEQTAINQLIAQTRQTGGYVLVTGGAGSGKSSLIAQLIVRAGVDQTPHHSIALNPSSDEQLKLLRSVFAQLMLKHQLINRYFPSDNYPALRLEFDRMLQELSAAGVAETIYLDGLDQLQPEVDGSRDLSFLPLQLPLGIVMVLGSRPDELIDYLVREQGLIYHVPALSEDDAITRWLQLQPTLDPARLADLARSLKGNALLVELAARAIGELPYAEVVPMLEQSVLDPTNLFRQRLARIERHTSTWQTLIKPILALLVVSQAPLHPAVLAELIQQPLNAVAETIALLAEWIISNDEQRLGIRHSLFHDFLAHHEFNEAELQTWHRHMATWCSVAFDQIWQDSPEPVEQARRSYARQHLITHLALAEQWELLWQLIDAGDYGAQKIRFDPSTKLYGFDLDRAYTSVIAAGQSIEQHFNLLPRLWRYSLLRTSLTNHIERWHFKVFVMLAIIGRVPEALAYIDMVYPERQVHSWAYVIRYATPEVQLQILQRMHHAIRSIRDPEDRVWAVSQLGLAYTNAGIPQNYPIDQGIKFTDQTVQLMLQQAKTKANQGLIDQAFHLFDQVFTTIAAIVPEYQQLCQFVLLIKQAKHYGYDSLCERIIEHVLIPIEAYSLSGAIKEIAEAYARAGDFTVANQALELIKHSWRFTQTAQKIAKIAYEQSIQPNPEPILKAAHKQINQRDAVDNQLDQLASAPHNSDAARSLLSTIYADDADLELQEFFTKAYQVAKSIDNQAKRIDALKQLAKAYAMINDLPRLRELIAEIMLLEVEDFQLESIALICVKQGHYAYAQELLQLQEPSPWKDEVLYSLIYQLIKSNQTMKAWQLIAGFSIPFNKESVAKDILSAQIERQQWEEIVKIIQHAWRNNWEMADLWGWSTLIVPLIPYYPWLGSAMIDAIPWVEHQKARYLTI
ncbi:AAA family ATPase [Herpetosiphon llansteffanensis]